MTEFVLEILDGDRAGEIFELTTEPLTFGRRQGNEIVLKDEKCSGRHATIVQEDGQWVLRDLDSTNGTLLDGRRVDEVGLTANDIFQVGITRVAFKEKGAPTPRNDLSVKTVDQATLAKTKRGGGVGMLLVLVLLLGAAAVWYFYLRGDGGGGGGPAGNRVKSPLRVAGNVLQGGDFEAEDGTVFETARGASFAREQDAAMSHTGTGYLAVRRAEAEGEEAGEVLPFGLARAVTAQTVAGGGAVTVEAFALTTGEARAAVRVRFTSSNEEQPQLMFTGTKPTRHEDYAKVALTVPVPAGCDRVAVELLALVPDGESEVLFDDVSLVTETDAKVESQLRTSVGQRATWSGSALQIDDGSRSILFGIDVATTDPTFAALAKAGLLAPSDLGLSVTVKDADGAIHLALEGGADADLTLRFEPGIASSGVLTRRGSGRFANAGTTLQSVEVDALMLGYGTARFLIERPKTGPVIAATGDREYRVTMPGITSCRLVYDLSKDRDAARELSRAAERLAGDGEFKAALDKLEEVIGVHPHDDRTLALALSLRGEIRNGLTDAIARYGQLLDEATYFGSLRGFRRIRDELEAMVARYGRIHIQKLAQVEAMLAGVGENIRGVEKIEGQEARRKLAVLASVYGESDQTIGKLIADYIEKHLPPADDPPGGSGDGSKDGDDKDGDNDQPEQTPVDEKENG